MVKVKITVKNNLHLSRKGAKFKEEFLNQSAHNAQEILSKNTPKLTRKGSNSYKILPKGDSREIRNDAFCLPWVNDGTGIYGPRGARIKPKQARVLHFTWKGRGFGKEMWVKSVAGQPGKHFVERSIPEIVRSLDSASVIAARRTFG